MFYNRLSCLQKKSRRYLTLTAEAPASSQLHHSGLTQGMQGTLGKNPHKIPKMRETSFVHGKDFAGAMREDR
jgi:hypothetical protein